MMKSQILLSITTQFVLLLVIGAELCFSFAPGGSNNRLTTKATRLYGKKTITKKSSDRAYHEHNFESMMGNDWREFRAKLVAQEKAAASLREATAYYSGSTLMAKHGRIGDLFAGSINIYDDRICGVLDCNDPFVSKDELPIILQKDISIDKHRWAHALPRPEVGSLLISNERFHQTVVLMISHCEKNGSSGVVINRPLDDNLRTQALDSLKDEFVESPVAYGGPMLPDEFSVIHSFGEVEGSLKLCNGVYIGGYEELVNEVPNRCDPRKCLFVKGHASWGAGQLADEIAQGVWHSAAASSDLILRFAGGKVSQVDNYHDLWGDLMKLINSCDHVENNHNNINALTLNDPGRSDSRVFYSE